MSDRPSRLDLATGIPVVPGTEKASHVYLTPDERQVLDAYLLTLAAPGERKQLWRGGSCSTSRPGGLGWCGSEKIFIADPCAVGSDEVSFIHQGDARRGSRSPE